MISTGGTGVGIGGGATSIFVLMPRVRRDARGVGASRSRKTRSSALRAPAGFARLSFGVRVDRFHALERGLRFRRATRAVVSSVQQLQLLECLSLTVRFRKLLGEHQANVVLIGTEIRKLFQRTKGFFHLTGLLHPVGVLEKIRFRVAVEPFGGADLPQFVIHSRAARRRPQNFVAQRDRVVKEAAFGIEIDGALVQRNGVWRVALPDEEIADAIVQADVDIFVTAGVKDVEDFAVRRNRLVELFFLLEIGGFLP